MVIARAARTPWSHVVADGLTSGAPRPAVQDATWIATRQIGDMVISDEAVKADDRDRRATAIELTARREVDSAAENTTAALLHTL